MKKKASILQGLYHSNRDSILFLGRLGLGLVVALVALKFFIGLTIGLVNDQLVLFDETVTQFVFAYRSPKLTNGVLLITNLGDEITYAIIILITGIFLHLKKYSRRCFFQAIVILISSAIMNILIKYLIARPRPAIELRLVEASSYSFPSGHSMAAMAFYGFLFFMAIRFVRNKALKALGTVIPLILIFSIGLSRVYLGVHYPSDVLAGFVAGFFWLVTCITTFSAVRYHRKWSKRKF